MSGSPHPHDGAGDANPDMFSPAAAIREIDQLIQRLEQHPDPEVREQVAAVLNGIDMVHRTALTRLVEGIRAMAGDAFLNRLTGDAAIRLLFMSYDLIAVDRRIQAEDALDLVRPHLHGHGVDVELVEVVGGVIRVQLHGVERGSELEAAARADVEAALREGLIGLQELEIGPPRAAAARPAPLVSLGVRRPMRQPVHRDAVAAEDVAPGTLHAVELAGEAILVVNVAGEYHAVANRCGDSPLPLQFGRLEQDVLHCSWHGCRYDVRTGRRVDGGEERLRVYPVRVENGRVQVTMDVAVPASGAVT